MLRSVVRFRNIRPGGRVSITIGEDVYQFVFDAEDPLPDALERLANAISHDKRAWNRYRVVAQIAGIAAFTENEPVQVEGRGLECSVVSEVYDDEAAVDA